MDGNQIQAGADRGSLRLWRATEAAHQAELHLAEQVSNLAALESRASWTLIWSSLALIGLAVTAASQGQLHVVAFVSATSLGVTVLCSIIGLWPQQWDRSGWTLPELEHMDHPTELDYREALAGGYAKLIANNQKRLTDSSITLRLAWIFFVIAGPAGLFAVFLTQG
jgi:hypothetical protein